jgi:hypothetical protein
MSAPDSELDKHLATLFGGLDTRADFDARLIARLRAESQTDATERAMRARQQELTRHRRAVLELQSRRRVTLRLLTLDALGISLLLMVAVITAWSRFGGDIMDISRQYGPYIAMLLAALIAAVPLLGIRREQTRSPIRLL